MPDTNKDLVKVAKDQLELFKILDSRITNLERGLWRTDVVAWVAIVLALLGWLGWFF